MDFLNLLKAGTKLSKKSNPVKPTVAPEMSKKRAAVKVNPVESFDELASRYNAPQFIVDNLKNEFKFPEPSPIQSHAWNLMLEGHRLMASAPTGSGKTLAFLVPLAIHLRAPGKKFCRALILQPTRELVNQTIREFQRLVGTKKFTSRILDNVTGNADDTTQVRKLDLAATTPLRLVTLIKEEKVKLDDVEMIVMDEADRLLDMGFQPQIDEILAAVPDISKVAVHLFSATMPDGVVRLAQNIIANPVRVAVGLANTAAASVKQELVFTTHEEGKLSALRQMVRSGQLPPPCLIFVQSKERAKQLFLEMVHEGWLVDVMHAERTKQQRDALVQSFRAGKIWFLICTDLMARGVDFKGVKCVLNFDLPQSSATYIHRVGRTGRGGAHGKALTFFTTSDMQIMSPVVNVMLESGCEVPEYLRKMKKMSRNDRKELEKNAPKRKHIGDIPFDGKKKKLLGVKEGWENGRPESDEESEVAYSDVEHMDSDAAYGGSDAESIDSDTV